MVVVIPISVIPSSCLRTVLHTNSSREQSLHSAPELCLKSLQNQPVPGSGGGAAESGTTGAAAQPDTAIEKAKNSVERNGEWLIGFLLALRSFLVRSGNVPYHKCLHLDKADVYPARRPGPDHRQHAQRLRAESDSVRAVAHRWHSARQTSPSSTWNCGIRGAPRNCSSGVPGETSR